MSAFSKYMFFPPFEVVCQFNPFEWKKIRVENLKLEDAMWKNYYMSVNGKPEHVKLRYKGRKVILKINKLVYRFIFSQ